MPRDLKPQNYSSKSKGVRKVQKVDTAAGLKKQIADYDKQLEAGRLTAEQREAIINRRVALEKKLIEMERPTPKVVPTTTGSIIAEHKNTRETRFMDSSLRI